jgi:hypothetical protein
MINILLVFFKLSLFSLLRAERDDFDEVEIRVSTHYKSFISIFFVTKYVFFPPLWGGQKGLFYFPIK